MQKQKRQRAKRIKNLVVICSLIAIVLTVSTYAWFIGMRTVNVSSFDVEIASTDSLLLSLNGSTWDTTVTISKANLTDVSYAGHTNNWGGEGLVPMSTIGEMDNTSSRMKLFEKASLTSTPGGYRLMASRVHNYEEGNAEQGGYVVFDLFIKNISGTQYIKDLEELDEEAIYLTNDSIVKIADAGGVANTGIENSVRVAFTQVGRVAGTTQAAGTITGITCTSDDDVTGICRDAQIWEPNDTDHVKNAISWYTTSCKKRTGANVTLPASYGGACGSIVDGLAYPTYAVKNDITSADNTDIYDGSAFNGYAASSKLEAYPYFTDTMKLLTGTSRPTFMTLAPNSITKLRIYVYIEGQDVDNYDFASIGKKISVKFGFTKERFTEDDIEYDGPELNEGAGPNPAEGEPVVPDKTAPVIVLNGVDESTPAVNPLTITLGGTYTEYGATATDKGTGTTVDVTDDIKITGTVNTNVVGTYRVLYTVTDAAGNTATKTRIVEVVEE